MRYQGYRLGRPRRPINRFLNISLDVRLVERVWRVAEAEGITLSTLVRRCLAETLEADRRREVARTCAVGRRPVAVVPQRWAARRVHRLLDRAAVSLRPVLVVGPDRRPTAVLIAVLKPWQVGRDKPVIRWV